MRTLTESEKQIIMNSGLFDSQWYSATYRDVAAAGLDPLEHFLRIGINWGRNPCRLFDSKHYLSQVSGKRPVEIPLLDYLSAGWREHLSPHPLFDLAWYLERNEDIVAAGIEPLGHFFQHGGMEGRQPHPAFPTHRVLERCPHLRETGRNPLDYYISGEWTENPLLKYKSSYEMADPEFVPRLSPEIALSQKSVRLIAFYLPQFHTIPENNKWWGEGFTEWTNVRPAQPQFEGHYQPHVPHDYLGYYNLLDRKTQAKQVELAKQYGIEGFCFYLYWFSGKRLLEKPLDKYLSDSSLDLPFCVCWANENWSRRWDGLESDLLMVQHYSDKDDIDFIRNIARYMRDQRYIRIEGKPLLLIYRPNLFPDMVATVKRWRDWCRFNGIGEIYLVYPQSFECIDPAIYDFDAAVEFPPNNSSPPDITGQVQPFVENFQGSVFDWRIFIERSHAYKDPGYKLFRAVNPSWDNTARKKTKGNIFQHSTPLGYQQWLFNAINDTHKRFQQHDERLVFVNAWNEWAEGAHLEPDQRHGYAYLEATRVAQARYNILCNRPQHSNNDQLAIVIHAYYPDVLENILENLPVSLRALCTLFVSTVDMHAETIRKIVAAHNISSEIFVFENRGRDILPFLKVLRVIEARGFGKLLKLHTKKSLHREDGDRWRDDLYSKLLDKRFCARLISYLSDHPAVGLIGPEGYIAPLAYYWGSNQKKVEAIARRLGIAELDIDTEQFIAGSMFYARVEALQPLLNLAIAEDDFEQELGQVDGTLAHAIERAIALSASSVQMTIVSTKDVLGSSQPCSDEMTNLDDFYKPDAVNSIELV